MPPSRASEMRLPITSTTTSGHTLRNGALLLVLVLALCVGVVRVIHDQYTKGIGVEILHVRFGTQAPQSISVYPPRKALRHPAQLHPLLPTSVLLGSLAARSAVTFPTGSRSDATPLPPTRLKPESEVMDVDYDRLFEADLVRLAALLPLLPAGSYDVSIWRDQLPVGAKVPPRI